MYLFVHNYSIGTHGHSMHVLSKHAQMRDVFVYNAENKLTKEKLMKLYTVLFSAEGANNREKEDDTIFCLEWFMDRHEGEAHYY